MRAKRDKEEKDLTEMPPQTLEKKHESEDSSELSSPPPSEDLEEAAASPSSTPSPSKKRILVVLKAFDSSDSEDDLPMSELRPRSSEYSKVHSHYIPHQNNFSNPSE
jgi:hypothetical protein